MCCSAFPRLRSHAPALGFLRDCSVPLCFSGFANRAPTKPNQVHSPAAPKSEPHAQAFEICPDRKNLVIMSGTMSEYMSDKVNALYFEFPDRLHSRQNKSKHNAPYVGLMFSLFNPDLRKIKSGLKTPPFLGHVGAMLGLCWVHFCPCWALAGHVGAMIGPS